MAYCELLPEARTFFMEFSVLDFTFATQFSRDCVITLNGSLVQPTLPDEQLEENKR